LPNLDFSVLDFNKPAGLNNRKFDYIIGIGILHHLYYEIDKALINLKGLLKGGGKIIFLEPNLLNPYCYLIFNTTPFFRKWAKLEPAEKAFSKKYIYSKLIKAGFNNIRIEYKDFLIPITPCSLVKPTIFIGDILEKIPVVKKIAQSIYFSASKD
jgi:SAM-dependent methyltransferase